MNVIPALERWMKEYCHDPEGQPELHILTEHIIFLQVKQQVTEQ